MTFLVVFFFATGFAEWGAVSSVMRGGFRLTELFFFATVFFFAAVFLAIVFVDVGFFVFVAANALLKLPQNKEVAIIKLVNIKNGFGNFINYLKS